MDDFLRLVTSDFERIASNTGFRFNQYNGSVDWEYLEKFVINDIVDNADVKSLSKLVASVLSYNIEKMSVSKKIFRLSQLIIDFLLHYKNYSTFKFNKKVDSMALCELCGKMSMDNSYLKYHCFCQHKLNLCTLTNSLDNEYVDSLKSKILQLQTQLKETTLTLENKLKNSQMYIDEHDLNKCNSVHKNKLSYHLIPEPYDNPMQVQEMYWKQKYESLEENYNTLKNEYEKNQSSTKSKTILDHKYQQCDFYKSEKFSKCIQTNILIEKSTPVCSPKRPPRRIDIIPADEYKGICGMDISDIDQTNLDGYQCNDNLSSDKDFYELKKLRLEARMNIDDNIDNNVCENLSEPLLSSDLVNSIKIVLILGPTRVNELFKNASLMDLIKFEIKDLVNKRLEDHYSFVDGIDESVEQDNSLHEKFENQMCSEVSICEDNKHEPHSCPEVDCNKTSVKKKKTVISKLKKKANRLSNIFSPSTKTKIIEVQPSTTQDPEISQSNEQCNNNNGNALLP